MQRSLTLPRVRQSHAHPLSSLLFLVIVMSGLLVVAQCLLLYTHPLLRGGVGQDAICLYVGALAIAHGLNPYTSAAHLGQQLTGISPHVHPFAYSIPPVGGLLAIPLTWTNMDAAYRILCLLNVASVLGTAVLVLVAAGAARDRQALVIVLAAVASGAAFLPNWYGQIAPPLTLAGAAALLLATRGRAGWAGAIVVATAMKPQLSLLALIVLFLAGSKRMRLGMALGAVAFVVLSLIASGPSGLLSFVLSNLHDEQSSGRQRVHNPDSMALDGVYYQLFSHTIAAVAFALTVLAVIVAGLLLLRIVRSDDVAPSMRRVALSALLLLCSLILPYSHQYDSALLLIPYILAAASVPSPRVRHCCIALALLAALAPYQDLFSGTNEVRVLPVIDFCATALLSLYCLKQHWPLVSGSLWRRARTTELRAA